MSSGVEADIALDAAVIATLGLIRVLGGAAGLTATGAGLLASLAEARAEERARRLQEARRHDEVIGEVLDRNARIAALTDVARRHGVELALPAPLDLTDRSADDLADWVGQVDGELTAAERSLAAELAASITPRIFAAVPDSLKAGPGARRTTEARTTDARPPDFAETLTRVLGRLLPDAAEEDQRAVAEAAERVAGATTPGEAEGRLTEVRIRVQEANSRARERRDGRAAAARFLRELRSHPAAVAVSARLAEVADGLRPFDDALRADAVRLLGEVKAQAEHQYVTTALREAFGELGYEVSEGFETLTARDGEALLTRGDWPHHVVKVRVDDARLVRMALLRTEPAEGDDQRRLDIEREEEWCASFEAARRRLADAGIRADVRWRVEPGEQRLPVARPQRARRQARERRRERDR